ncbi:MAG: hypothetical protein CBC48_17490 [bacterium TMED88]|nr:hypothetical protein [Deltaproteobacteria bacterium]OUV24424.1 MAG: hypothetical protein CBC48_17490 [bacterium TMED88]
MKTQAACASERDPWRQALILLGVMGLLCAAGVGHAEPPPAEGECPTLNAAGTGPDGQDAAPILLKEGMRVNADGILALQSLIPEEVWLHREAFFFEGMMMQIGPCHRRYASARAYQEATDRFAGQATLDRKGNLSDYTAGAPFPQEWIQAEDPQAALKWAWNLEKRWRGAGAHGRFRLTNLPVRMGPAMRFIGRFFVFQTAERADLAKTDYRWSGTNKMLWAEGGEFESPFSARGLAWRQFRPPKAQRKWREPDDIFVYVPSLRKMRRSGTPWVDGAFVPAYMVAGRTPGGGGLALGGQGGGGINPGAGPSLAISENARSGLTGLFLRPNAYVWRLRGTQNVIAPLNGDNSGWPIREERNYGPSGLSVAGDRWDVRHAIVIEGALRERSETIRTLTVYVDYHTLQPLYWATRTDKRRLVEVGILVHRYSADREQPAVLADGATANVFEPVAASFFNALAGRGGWLRESYELNSTPYTESERRRMSTNHALQRGH